MNKGLTMTRVLILSLVALTVLSACSRGQRGNLWGNRQMFDGQYFRAKLESDKTNRKAFQVTVNDARKTLVGAREAARVKAVEYCIRQYGRSDITWAQAPDVEDANLTLVNGALVVSGECAGW